MKKGGKGVPSTGNLAHLLPPPHANKNQSSKMSWAETSGAPSASLSQLRHPPESPAAAGLQTVLPKAREGFKR